MKTFAKNFVMVLTLLALLMGFAMGATISSQGFETNLSGYSHTPSQTPATDPGDQYFYRAEPSDAAIYEGSVGPYTNVTGSWLFVGSNPNTINSSNPGVLTLDAINVSGYSSLEFSADWGACPNDWDSSDELKVEYNWDGGSWATLYYFQVNAGSDGTNEPLEVAGNASGGNNTANGTGLTYALTSVVSDNFTGSGTNLNIKITCNSGANYEAFGVDNIVVSGTPAGGVDDPTSFTATTASTSQINLTWTDNAAADDVMVVFDLDNSFTDPVNGNTYSGSALGGTVIYQGAVEAYNHTSLSAYTAYYYKAWSVDASDNYSSGVTDNATTLKTEPSNHATSFTASDVSFNQMTLTWADNDGSVAADKFLVAFSAAAITFAPTDGNVYPDDLDDTNSDYMWFANVTSGTQTATLSDLTPETTYYSKIWPYSNSGGDTDYKTDGTVPSVTQATTAAPEIPDFFISEVADPGNVWEARFVELFNASGSTIDLGAGSYYLARQSNGDSWADIALSGTVASCSTYVVAYSQSDFETNYNPKTANLYNGNINGNGDDGYFLYAGGTHTTGALVDAYGVIDEDGSGKPWEYLDSRAMRNAAVSSPNSTWTASEWTIASANVADCTPCEHTSNDAPTPITLSFFTATAVNGMVELAWETATETNNARFVIYRNGEAIGSIDGAGTTTEPHNYTFTDNTVVPGMTYTYVLADMSYANEETRYEDNAVTVIVGNDLVEADFVVGAAYPNPFNPTAVVPLELSRDAMVKASLYDLNGREIKALVNANFTAGTHELRIDGAGLTTGMYLVQVVVENVVDVQKIALMK